MNNLTVATQSLRHYWRTNLAVALGVAAATAVLSGALIVGDSMRGSLRALTLDRLAGIDEVVIAEGFFRTALAQEIRQTRSFYTFYEKSIPGIYFPSASLQVENDVGRRVTVAAFGCVEEFWDLDDAKNRPAILPNDRTVVINEQLARELGIEEKDLKADSTLRFVLHLPIKEKLSSDSALGKKGKLTAPVIDLKIGAIIPDHGLGRFGLHSTQMAPRNVYLPMELIQNALATNVLKNKADQNQANVVFLQAKRPAPPAEITAALIRELRPGFDDLDFRVQRATQKFTAADGQEQTVFDYFSFSSDRLVIPPAAETALTDAFPDATRVFTYLANRMKLVPLGNEPTGEIPFSMISGIEFDKFQPVSEITGQKVAAIEKNDIVLNRWAAEDLGAKVGDRIAVDYFEPEATHGETETSTTEFVVKDILALTRPERPFRRGGRNQVRPAEFEAMPTLANDPDLTPTVPGLTDAGSINDWDLPFETPGIRDADDDYWNYYRTTPKAFVSLETAQSLWSSRFGSLTSIRIDPQGRTESEIKSAFLDALRRRGEHLGFQVVPVKRTGLKASSGATPFDVLFLSLSMFVIVAALILVSLLFRLSLTGRANEIGLMSAVGLPYRQVVRIWLMEMFLVCVIGAILGVIAGIGYAALMIYGLRTWWVDAVRTPFLFLYVGWLSILIGVVSGILVCIATIWISVVRLKSQPVRSLLAGEIESKATNRVAASRRLNWIAVSMGGLAFVLAIVATQLGGEAQAGAFMGAGFLVLAAMLLIVWKRLRGPASSAASDLSLFRLAITNAKRSPLRSVLSIGLVAVASFLIVSTSSFRMAPSETGTAGFDFIGTTNQPLFDNLNTEKGRAKLLQSKTPNGAQVLSMRFKSGENASCNNPYQSTQPRTIGIPQEFVEYFDGDVAQFAWAGTSAKSADEKRNPWKLLNSRTADGAIPVIIDKNTAWYSLKVYLVGSVFDVKYDSGETVKYQVAGFLNNSVLHGSLLISENNFTDVFRDESGYRYFLTRAADAESSKELNQVLERDLSDQGYDGQSTRELLAEYLAVQNTYLSTFQSLGALGLLLGTFGLAAVQLRSVFERRRELALLRAVGFANRRLARLVLMENLFLLVAGLLIGLISAIFSTLPHMLFGDASVPWFEFCVMFVLICVVGLLTSWFASRRVMTLPLLDSLRS